MSISPSWAVTVMDAVIAIGRSKFTLDWSIESASSDEVNDAYSTLLHELATGQKEATACWTHTGKFYSVNAGRWFADDAMQFLKAEQIRMKLTRHGASHCKLFIRKRLSAESATTDDNKAHPTKEARVKKNGRPSGTGLHDADAVLINQMRTFIIEKKPRSPTAAAKALFNNGSDIPGDGTPESRVSRIVRRYKEEFPAV